MNNDLLKGLALAAAATVTVATPAFAGGLSDAIVERQPEVVAQTAPAAVPGWVLPAVALVLLGAVASGGGDGGDGDGGGSTGTPPTLDPK